MKGQKGIFERPPNSNIWWIRFIDAGGKERREKAGTKSVAKLLYQKRKQEALEGKKLPEKLRTRTVLFGELVGDAIEHVESQAVLGKDGRYSCKIDLIRDAFASSEVGSITPQEISRWLTKTLRDRKWKPATANRYKAFLSLCFRLGIENSKCSQNPARFVRRLRENNERVRFLTDEEEIRLRDAIQAECPEHMADLDVALNTGMRKGEQYGLDWKDVDLQARRVTLGRRRTAQFGTSPSTRSRWRHSGLLPAGPGVVVGSSVRLRDRIQFFHIVSGGTLWSRKQGSLTFIGTIAGTISHQKR